MTLQESGLHIKGHKGRNNLFIFTPGCFQQVRLRTLEKVIFLDTTRYHQRRYLTTTGFWGWAVRPCAPAPREVLNWDSRSHHLQCGRSSSRDRVQLKSPEVANREQPWQWHQTSVLSQPGTWRVQRNSSLSRFCPGSAASVELASLVCFSFCS